MSDLARSLVDAAAEAIGAAVHMPGSRAQAEQAVAAVLETLAAHHHDNGGIFGAAHIEALRRLAVEAREVER